MTCEVSDTRRLIPLTLGNLHNGHFIRKASNVALGAVMVGFSNYSYKPSLSTRSAAGKEPVTCADVFGIFRDKLSEIEADI